MRFINLFSEKRLAELRHGFTLVELVVVISLMVMIMLTVTSLFFTSLISSTKTSTSAKIKEEGDFAVDQIEFLLRNAVKLVPNTGGETCGASMTEIRFQSHDDGITSLTAEDDNGVFKIASNSGVYLTSGDVVLEDNQILFTCTQANDGSAQYVTVDFTLRKGTPGVDQPRDIVTQDFSTGVAIRNRGF